jgi:hypothetical protein
MVDPGETLAFFRAGSIAEIQILVFTARTTGVRKGAFKWVIGRWYFVISMTLNSGVASLK